MGRGAWPFLVDGSPWAPWDSMGTPGDPRGPTELPWCPMGAYTHGSLWPGGWIETVITNNLFKLILNPGAPMGPTVSPWGPMPTSEGGRYLYDSFSTLWEIKVFGAPGEYGHKAGS